MAKSRIFGDLLQGSHTTSEHQTPTGTMLPLGLLVLQVCPILRRSCANFCWTDMELPLYDWWFHL